MKHLSKRSFQVGVAGGFMAVAMAGSILVSPPQAQAQGFSFQDSLASLRDSVSNTFQRLYLQLPGQKSGKLVLKQSLEATSQLETMQVASTIEVAAADQAGQSLLDFSLITTGPVKVADAYDPSSLQQEMNMTGSLQVEGTTLELDLDMKQTADATYIRLNQIPAIPGFDLRQIKDQWISIPTDPGMLEAEFDAELEALTEAERRQLEAATRRLFDSAEVGPAVRETKDGNSVFVISISLSDEVIMTWLEEVQAITEPEATTDDLTQMRQLLDTLQPIEAEVWVDARSLYLRHFQLPMVVDVAAAQDQLAQAEEAAGAVGVEDLSEASSIEILIAATVSDFNLPVSFEAPADATPFMEVFSTLMPGFGPELGVGTVGSAAPALGEFPTSDFPGSDELPADLTAPSGPAELPELTEQEKALLESYGFSAEDLEGLGDF